MSQNGQHGAELFLNRLFVKKLETDTNLCRKELFFSMPLTSCFGCYLSCLYMWKTEQQTAASTSLGRSAELDFPPFPQCLTDCTLFTKKREAKESPLCARTSCPNVSSSGHKQVGCVFPLTITITHTSSALTREEVTASHSVTVSVTNSFLPSYRKAVWTPMLCRLRSVCAVVPSVCLLLHQGLDEWLYWLHEKKKSGYYWYS